MNAKERVAFRAIVKELQQRGIAWKPIELLIVDFVLTEARLKTLRGTERASRGKAKAAATRALNVALAERRRLHRTIFGSEVEADPPPTPGEVEQLDRQRRGDDAWRKVIFPSKQLIAAKRLVEERRLKRLFGEPSFPALVYSTSAEELEADAAIARHRDRSRGGRPRGPRGATR